METFDQHEANQIVDALRTLGSYGATAVTFDRTGNRGARAKRLLEEKFHNMESLHPRPSIRIPPTINGSKWYGVTVQFPDEAAP